MRLLCLIAEMKWSCNFKMWADFLNIRGMGLCLLLLVFGCGRHRPDAPPGNELDRLLAGYVSAPAVGSPYTDRVLYKDDAYTVWERGHVFSGGISHLRDVGEVTGIVCVSWRDKAILVEEAVTGITQWRTAVIPGADRDIDGKEKLHLLYYQFTEPGRMAYRARIAEFFRGTVKEQREKEFQPCSTSDQGDIVAHLFLPLIGLDGRAHFWEVEIVYVMPTGRIDAITVVGAN